jgi:uncharacterized membrane protein
MERWKQLHAKQQRLEFIGTQLTLAALAVAAVAPLAVLISLVPRAQVLPFMCLIALVGAALVSLAAWWCGAKRQGEHITFWDVAGALALIGFAAGMLSEPSSVLQLFAQEATRH